MTECKIGSEAPDFDAVAIDGSLFSFRKHQEAHDTWHLLIFFRGSWCPVCQETLKELNNYYSRFLENNIHPVTISSDGITELKALSEKYQLKFPVLGDKDAFAAKRYGVMIHGDDTPYEDHGEHNEPAAFLIDERGRILYLYLQTGPFGRPSAQDIEKTANYIRKSLK